MSRYEVCRAAVSAAVITTLMLMTAACGAPAGTPLPSPSPVGPAPSEGEPIPTEGRRAGGAMTLVGTLGGDAHLEGGCVWLDAEGRRYELQLPEGYTVTFSPLQMIGREGEVVAGEGDRLRLIGRTVDDIATICQIGPVFNASQVHPL